MELKEFEVGLGQMFEDGSPVVIAVDENNNPRLLGKEKVYLKSEADKVIAELEMKLAIARQVLRLNKPEALYSNLETMSRLNHEKYVIARRERHHKYKRCLAMARWCDDAARLATWDADFHRCGWYNKWMQHWLELAEKFKEKAK